MAFGTTVLTLSVYELRFINSGKPKGHAFHTRTLVEARIHQSHLEAAMSILTMAPLSVFFTVAHMDTDRLQALRASAAPPLDHAALPAP